MRIVFSEDEFSGRLIDLVDHRQARRQIVAVCLRHDQDVLNRDLAEGMFAAAEKD